MRGKTNLSIISNHYRLLLKVSSYFLGNLGSSNNICVVQMFEDEHKDILLNLLEGMLLTFISGGNESPGEGSIIGR